MFPSSNSYLFIYLFINVFSIISFCIFHLCQFQYVPCYWKDISSRLSFIADHINHSIFWKNLAPDHVSFFTLILFCFNSSLWWLFYLVLHPLCRKEVVNHARVYWDGLLTYIFGSFEALMQKS